MGRQLRQSDIAQQAYGRQLQFLRLFGILLSSPLREDSWSDNCSVVYVR